MSGDLDDLAIHVISIRLKRIELTLFVELLIVAFCKGLNQKFKVPLTCSLQISNLLFFGFGVRLDEFWKTGVASSNSNDKLVVHDLGVDLSGTEKIVSWLKTPDGNVDGVFVKILGKQLIDLISRDSPVTHILWLDNFSISIC